MSGGTTTVPQFASLYVGDLHPEVTEAILYEIFNSVGTVGSIRVCRDSITRRSLGYGYVNFHSVNDAERALDTLNYSSIKGRACRLMWSQRDPSLRKSGVGNIYVKNLDRNIDNKALYDTFSLFGNILSCKVATDANGKSRGYGFVHYETEGACKQSIERVNDMQIGENKVQVTKVVKRCDRADPSKEVFTNLYIKCIPATGFSEEDMKDLFEAIGPITSSCIMEDKLGRKFGFVNFETPEDSKKAIDDLNGRDMRTTEQKANEELKAEDFALFVGRAMTKVERSKELKKEAEAAAAPAAGKGSSGVNLYVKNLDEDTNDDKLQELFAPFGTVASCVVMKDEKDRCKGFGFVCFESPSEATQAVTEMHLKVVNGKPLYVGLAEKREARQERLRQRYSPAAAGHKGGKGGKGGKDGKGKGKGKAGPGMMPGQLMGMGGLPGAPMGGMPPAMGMPQMGMMGMRMLPPQMMGKGGPMMGGKGPLGMMGAHPAMMSMMAQKGAHPGVTPAMMSMMAQKGAHPGMLSPQMMMAQKGAHPGMMGMMPGGPGMMRPMMPQMQHGMPPQHGLPPQVPPPQPLAAAPVPGGPLTAAALAAAPAGVQKQMLGEKLFPAVCRYQPELAGKITGMMLEMDNSELLMLLESDVQLKSKVEEAMRVIEGGRTAPA